MPKRVPGIGSTLGKGIKEVQKSKCEVQDNLTKKETEAPKVENVEAVEKASEPVVVAERVKAAEPVNADEAVAAPEPEAAPEPQSTETKTS